MTLGRQCTLSHSTFTAREQNDEPTLTPDQLREGADWTSTAQDIDHGYI